MKTKRILIVDDELSIRKFVTRILQENQYEAISAFDGESALEAFEAHRPDLVVLDITMPDIDGFEVLKQLRKSSLVPVIMLSCRQSEEDKVRSLETGADDYITKPFGIDEFLARVHAVLRRSTKSASSMATKLVAGAFEFDFIERKAFFHSRQLKLTATEYNLLKELCAHAGKVVTHRELLSRVWGSEYFDESQYVHVYINRLRRLLSDDSGSNKYILSVPGIGYQFRKS